MTSFTLLLRDGRIVAFGPGECPPVSGDDFVWEHFERENGDDLASLLKRADIPEVVLAALVAAETRPRCDQIDDGALLNLRGLALEPADDGDRLVSIRAWVRGNRVTSASRRTLAATATAEKAMRAGLLTDPGDLVAAYARAISNALDPRVAALGDEADDCEIEVEASNLYNLRRHIAGIRSEAIAYRRFIAPNRNALLSLADLDMTWLAADDRLHIREAADRFARMAEELEAVRERAALLHEQLTDMRTELIDRRSLLIAVVAFIFLPLTFITGLLGMNVEGIPFAHAPWAFWGVVTFCLAVGAVVLGWFGWRHWLER